jgi:hypothetical protein
VSVVDRTTTCGRAPALASTHRSPITALTAPHRTAREKTMDYAHPLTLGLQIPAGPGEPDLTLALLAEEAGFDVVVTPRPRTAGSTAGRRSRGSPG